MHESNFRLHTSPLVQVENILRWCYIGIGLGIIACIWGIAFDQQRVWVSLLHNHFYFMSLSLGGIFFASLQWITSARWSVAIRRIMESFSNYLPIVLISFVVVLLGYNRLFSWSDLANFPEKELLLAKQSYLNFPFFGLRNFLIIIAWIVFSKLLVRHSLRQDQDQEHPEYWNDKNKRLIPGFLIVFTLGFSIASFDLIMSLDPLWFSTIFGVYCFSGLFYATLALTTVVVIGIQKKQNIGFLINENHLHDLGKYMFAFSIFWAYIGFSQFMLIWYANLPEETSFYLKRLEGLWSFASAALLLKFLVPFFLLMPRQAKRHPKLLLAVGLFMLIAHWFDLLWLIQPEFFPQGPKMSFIECGIAVGFLGVFGLMVVHFLRRHPLMPMRDPYLTESLHHHQ